MGKRKDKKKLEADVSENQKVDVDDFASIESNTVNAQQKKKSRKKDLDNWEDEVQNEFAMMSLDHDKVNNAIPDEPKKNSKSKKGKKNQDIDDWDEIMDDDLPPSKDGNVTSAGDIGKGKKGKKKKKKDDNWEDDIDKELEMIATGQDPDDNKDEEVIKKKTKANKKGKKRRDDDWEDDIEQELGMIAAGQDPTDDKDNENEKKKKSNKKGEKKKDDMKNEAQNGDGTLHLEDKNDEPVDTAKNRKGKKKKKKNDNWEDDIEKELGMIAAGQEPTDDKDDDADSKKKPKPNKKTEKKKTESKNEAQNGDGTLHFEDKNDESVDTAKNKKGKKKKKKNDNWEDDIEKELGMIAAGQEPTDDKDDDADSKKKPKANKKTEKKKTESKPVQEVSETKESLVETEGIDAKSGTEQGSEVGEKGPTSTAEDIPATEGTKKKKKKKKGAKDEEEKATKKKPSKAIRMMQEALRKRKEEEENFRLAEEEKIRQEEEAFRRRQEELERIERKKQLKKEARKERILKQKKEGVYLTPAQREAKKRNEAYLKQLEEQGIRLPVKGQETGKRPLYGSRKKPNKSQPKPKETVKEKIAPEEVEKKTVEEDVSDEKEEVEEKVPESESESDDDWEMIADKEEAKQKDEVDEEESSSEEEESESEEEEEEKSEEELSSREKALHRIEKLRQLNQKKRSTDDLRSPVICVMGHVDTGKTKILDKIRHTNVQDGEAGGITQQIGATNIPVAAIEEQTNMVKNFSDIRVPGLLVIDTPGHESFSNLRSRGSSLCDMAILVVDIMHGLEPQTIESINMLRKKKTPFVVALNKVDRLYRWKPNPKLDIVTTISQQDNFTKDEFQKRVNQVIVEFAKQELNVKLFNENDDPDEWISMVPTSAHSGDGMGNLMAYVVQHCQSHLAKRLAFSETLQCTVLEVKAIVGLGTTVDVILTNGRLKYGDNIVLPGVEGPIVTHIKGLLMPQPLKELRVKNPYNQFREVKAAQGVKVLAKELDKALAGTSLLVAHHDDEVDILKEEVQAEIDRALRGIKLQERGVFVQASTLGSLEALLEFLKQSKIPYAGINIGPIHKRDVMRASVMLEHDEQWAVILAFDVKVEREAQELADSLDVKIFTADIIYHLFDAFMKYREDLKRQKQDELRHLAIFPCKIKIVPNCVFKSRDPIVVGVSIEAGQLRVGTPLCVPDKEFLSVGVVASIEANHKPIEIARFPQEVCIKIEGIQGEAPKMVGRHFDEKDLLTSKISRDSIDLLKNYFREEMQVLDWKLVIELKKLFEII